MLICVMGVELVVVHLLLAHWWPVVAWVLSALTLAFLGWLMWAVSSFARRPVLIADDALILRLGALGRCVVPWPNVGHVTGEIDRQSVQRRTTLNLAPLGWPNVLIELRQPSQAGRRSIEAVAHRLDDPVAFLAAVGERTGE